MDEKRPSELPVPVLIAAVLSFLALSALFFVYLYGWQQRPDLVEISKYTCVRFPKSANLMESRMVQITHRSINAKIEIDKSDVKAFYTQFKDNQGSNPKEVVPVLERYVSDSYSNWWKPGSLKEPLTFFDAGNRVYGVIGLDDHGRTVVYIWQYPN